MEQQLTKLASLSTEWVELGASVKDGEGNLGGYITDLLWFLADLGAQLGIETLAPVADMGEVKAANALDTVPVTIEAFALLFFLHLNGHGFSLTPFWPCYFIV